MNPKQKFLARYGDLTKSVVELVEVLSEVDLDDPANNANEWSITDGEGGRIVLSYDPIRQNLTISKGRLKLTVDVKELEK